MSLPPMLHPHGTVRVATVGPGGDRSTFRALASSAARLDLGPDALVFAEQLLAADTFLDEPQRERVAYLVLALLTCQRQGATCLPLDGKGPLRDVVQTLNKALGRRLTADALIATARELARGHFASIIGSPGQRRPLIVDGDLLYVHRDHQHERRVAAAVHARLRPAPSPPPAPPAADAAGLALTPEQAAAVDTALAHHLAVIIGGPGTGKTAIAVAIVARLLAAGVRDVALAAPTGRAAQRLGESVARGLGPDAPPGMTLHRLLGARGGDFAHHARAPLPHGAVLVDEASMVDARLLDALLAALPPSARLILLGDADQLPSVDAGQALADLVAGLPPSAVARLHTSFRMSPSDPDGAHVLAAAAAIRAGDADALLTGKARRLRHEDRDADQLAGAPRGATFHPCEPSALPAVLDAWFERMTTEAFWRAATRDHRFDPTLGAFAPESDAALRDLLAGFGRSRLLAATRGDAAGTTAIGSYLHARLAGAGQRTDGGAEFVPGEPVVMTANDHARGLWNGDVGVIARVRTDGDGDAGHGRWRVVFARGTALVPLPIDALRDRLERAWAITVHKSQGSEADDVTLVLPADDSPLLTRELLYTAVTRARRGVRLVGRRAVLQAALGRRAARTTGLAARLLAPALPAPEASS